MKQTTSFFDNLSFLAPSAYDIEVQTNWLGGSRKPKPCCRILVETDRDGISLGRV